MGRDLFIRTPPLRWDDPETARAELLAYFHADFDRYERLFETLASDEAYYKKPIPLRHPLIFYYGHTATFFVNKMILAGLLERRIEPRFESVFAVGVDEMSWDDLDDTHYDWPRVDAVKAYRDAVRDTVDRVIRRAPLSLPVDWRNPWWTVLMGIEHERIHLETSSVLIRQHDLKYVKPHPAWTPCRECGPAPRNELVDIPAGAVRLGKSFSDPYYGWDNEYGVHMADVPAFRAGRHLVSNGEFLGFVEDGGYREDVWWEEEGASWKRYAQAAHPTFWVRGEDGWRLRLMLEEVPMPWDWPAETNYHEAKAFCNWKKAREGLSVRLPTEDEWHRLFEFSGAGEVPSDRPATANLHLDHWASSCPVNRFRHGEIFDATGNVWQWTETPTYPFDGFEVHPYYDDFTAPTFDDRHNLIKGGAWISCGNEALSVSRYAFRRHFFQHAGFRYVVGEPPVLRIRSGFETDPQLSELAEAHYGDVCLGVANFSETLAKLAIAAMQGRPARKALDIGCGAGRASFELARHFDAVDGVDFSARTIGMGIEMAERGVLRYVLIDEGELSLYKERRLAELGLDSVRGKVDFRQGDACNLKASFAGYDLILADDLLDRLYSPAKFLAQVHERLNPGGLLVVASSYDWRSDATPREEWLGGIKKDGESFRSLAGLEAILASRFRRAGAPVEVPCAIRQTGRRIRYRMLETTVWEKIE